MTLLPEGVKYEASDLASREKREGSISGSGGVLRYGADFVEGIQ
ncbi:hypothetical protein [Paenibacillus thiaminolyticus]|nr:hypothetical protein [Paenibacillus thiaminolyticus]